MKIQGTCTTEPRKKEKRQNHKAQWLVSSQNHGTDQSTEIRNLKVYIQCLLHGWQKLLRYSGGSTEMRRKHEGRFTAWTTSDLEREGVITDDISETSVLPLCSLFCRGGPD